MAKMQGRAQCDGGRAGGAHARASIQLRPLFSANICSVLGRRRPVSSVPAVKGSKAVGALAMPSARALQLQTGPRDGLCTFCGCAAAQGSELIVWHPAVAGGRLVWGCLYVHCCLYCVQPMTPPLASGSLRGGEGEA